MTKTTTPQTEPKVDSDTADGANVAVAEQADTVVLEGEKVEDVIDYTNVLKLQEDKHRITDKNGKSANSPLWKRDPKTGERYKKAFPDWHYAWVRNGKDGRTSQIGQRQMEKYIIVTPQTDPDLVVPALSDTVKKNGRYETEELTLMKLRMEYKLQRDAFFKAKNDARVAEIKRDLNQKIGGDVYGEVEINERGG
jgi:hypothetical protein